MSHETSLAQPWRSWYALLRQREFGARRRRLGRLPRARLLAWPIVVLVVTACGPDAGQASLCQRVLLEVEGLPEGAEIVDRGQDDSVPYTVILTFQTSGADGKARRGRFACRFAGGRFDDGRIELVGVKTDSQGELSAAATVFLRRKLGL